jgi:hypothetical protein
MTGNALQQCLILACRKPVRDFQILRALPPTPTRSSHRSLAISDERVRVKDGTQLQTFNYSEMGFEDRRSGKPNEGWGTLRNRQSRRFHP